jgi:CHAT domain-containing protein
MLPYHSRAVAEIAHLNLNADLVVLSACETGFGKFEQGEGVISLARSFMYAGSPSLVVSLWQVNDHSTSIVMQKFYQNLHNERAKDVVLRQAKLDYVQEKEGIVGHPAFWSAFIQLGDSRPIMLSRKGGWLYWIIGLGVLFVVVGSLMLKKKNLLT